MAAVPGDMYSYIFAEVIAAAVWEKYLQVMQGLWSTGDVGSHL